MRMMCFHGRPHKFFQGDKADILLIFRFLTIIGVNDGGANRLPWEAKYKTGPLLIL